MADRPTNMSNRIEEAKVDRRRRQAIVSVQVTLKAVLCHALRLRGRMSDALALNIEATDRASEIGKFDRQTLGFDVEHLADARCAATHW